MTAPGPFELQRALLDGPDTVTDFLETLTGERLVADPVRHRPMAAADPNDLGVAAGRELTRRTALLKGGTSGRPYVYAASLFVPDRLPERVRAQLEEGTDPIGRVLAAHGLRPVRVPLARSERPEGPDDDGSGDLPGLTPAIVWSRAYRLTRDGLTLFAIREWFLRPVLEALKRGPVS